MNFKRPLKSIQEHLRLAEYSSPLLITPHGELYLHWGDCSLARKYQQELIQTKDEVATHRWKRLDTALGFLKAHRVWIKSQDRLVESTMYDLYFLDLFHKDEAQELLNEESLISQSGRPGEFVPFHLMHWHAPLLYRQFIYEKTLSSELPVRQFRLRTTLGFPVEFPRTGQKTTLQVEQISDAGLLLSHGLVDNKSKVLMNEKELVAHFNLFHFRRLQDKSLDEIRTDATLELPNMPLFGHKDGKSFYKVALNEAINFQNILQQKLYLFVPYDLFLAQGGALNISALEKFIKNIESQVMIELNQHVNKKKAA